MTKEEFINNVKLLGINVSEEALEKLDIYLNYLLEYNAHTNLTAIKNVDDIYLKHFYDSLTITKVIDLTNENSLLDIGSGAGFPGVVLKIFFPHLNLTLVDSNNKKTKFLTNLVEKSNLSNVEVINDRIENITLARLNYYDIVTARAVTNMTVLTELAMPLVKENKYFIAMKGSNQLEISDSLYAIAQMGGIVEVQEVFNLYNDQDTRTIIKIRKTRETNKSEIRAYDKIIKKPLQNRGK